MPNRSIFYGQQIKRIIIRTANWVGDALMTTPAIRAVRKQFPGARIALLAKPWVSPIFDHTPHIDELLSYDSASRHAGMIGKWRLSRELHQRRFDLAVLFPNSFESALIVFGAGIPRRLGYTTDARSLLLTHRVHRHPAYKQMHQINYYLNLVKQAGIAPHGTQMALSISAAEQRQAANTLRQCGLLGNETLIGINPGAQFGTAKRWLPERFAQLSRRLNTHWQAHSLIFGSPHEKSLGEQIASRIGKNAINFCGKTSLREAIALIAQCHMFITNDSGLMHAAAALEIPLVALIGPTNPHITGPKNTRSMIIQEPVTCSPCLLPDCPIDHRCMKRISVDRVYKEVVSFGDEFIGI
jgi:heptosyltransferase-2